jgi:hypothetical protein
VDIGDVTTIQYNSIEIKSTGIGWIDKTGTSKIGIREGHDALDNPIDTGGGEAYYLNYVGFYLSERTGTDEDPYFDITTRSRTVNIT